jgi:hypothetical protein
MQKNEQDDLKNLLRETMENSLASIQKEERPFGAFALYAAARLLHLFGQHIEKVLDLLLLHMP